MIDPKRVSFALIGIVVLYVLSFYVLMVPNCPAVDDNGQIRFSNCPRLSRLVRVPGPLGIYTGRANALNYVYYPFEFLHGSGSNRRQ